MELILVFLAALCLYSATLAPTVVWGDGATMAVSVFRGDPLTFGEAVDHPLYIGIGQLLYPVSRDVAWRLNFQSAVFGALAVTLVYRCGRQLGVSRLAAATGAAALCVSHAFWLHSVMAEVYSANAFFVAATLSSLFAWRNRPDWRRLTAALTVFVIGLTNHIVLMAVVPAATVFAARTMRAFVAVRRLVTISAAAFSIGFGILVITRPHESRFFRRLWIGPPGISEYFAPSLDLISMGREAGYYLLYLAYQFPSSSLALGILGARSIVQHDRGAAILLLGAIAVNAGVFIHHTGWQSAGTAKYVFYITDYVVFSILCALGADVVRNRLSRFPPQVQTIGPVALLVLAATMPPLVYGTLPIFANRFGLDVVKAQPMAYRDNQRYFLNPNKRGEDGARKFAMEAFRAVKPSAVIFADFTPFSVLYYLQVVEGVRPDVVLRTSSGKDGTVHVDWPDGDRRRPTYVARFAPGFYDFGRLKGGYELVPAGPILEVRARERP